MHSAERERLVRTYNAGNSSNAPLICGSCLATLVLIVVLGAPRADESAQATRPIALVAASAKGIGAQSERHRRHTFDARRVAFNEGHHS
jgi:hypothetical protein